MERAASATMRPFPIGYVRARAQPGSVPISGRGRQERPESSNRGQAAPCSMNYDHDAALLDYLLSLTRLFYSPISSGGRPMTEPTDIGRPLTVTSRRRFL